MSAISEGTKMKKYRVAEVVDWGTPRVHIVPMYYPQVRKFGVWFYFDDPEGRCGDKVCFRSEGRAWAWIENHKQLGVKYIYE